MSIDDRRRPDISVCIANYNGDPYVRECLASVFSQKCEARVEVLLHDDCSTDDSLAMVRAEFPNVSILESEANVGFCISNNRMVARASGRYVLLLNNDATLRPGALAALLDFADSGHQRDVLGLPQYSQEGHGPPMDRGYRTDVFLNPIPVLARGNHEVGVATGACLWIPRSVWDEIGGFPEWFESVAEDIYLCLAARLLGRRVIVLDDPGFDHWVGRNLGGGKVVSHRLETTVRRRALSERNKTFTMLVCYPGAILFCLIPVHAVLLAMEAAFLLLRGIGGEKIRRIYAPIVPSIWQRRRQIRALREHLKVRRRSTLPQFFSQTDWLPHKLSMLLRHGTPKLN